MVRPASGRQQQGGSVRIDVTVEEGRNAGPEASAGAEPDLAQLLAELMSAGLVAVEASDDGEPSYALTPQGQSTARQMALSGEAHALVLLGALSTAADEPN